MRIPESELILNSDGSIYHLNLLPSDIANTIITVGDPDRVDQVVSHFNSIEVTKQKREFKTVTGMFKNNRLTVISTGIGTDNIDIVLNELDALVNVDFNSRLVKPSLTSLNIIRIGTSGAIQKSIPVDSFLLSDLAIGFDSLLHFYDSETVQEKDISSALMLHLNWPKNKSNPFIVSSDKGFSSRFNSSKVINGFTGTNVGFYGPQSRSIRLKLNDENLNNKLASFLYNDKVITNLEMETAGIYGLAKLLGHKAVSMNAILANRATQEFSQKPHETVNSLIEYCLNKLVS